MTHTIEEHAFPETRPVPETGLWAALARPGANGNTDFPAGHDVLLAFPGRVEVAGHLPGGGLLGLYRTDRDPTGSEAWNGALVRICAQAARRLPAARRGDA